MSISEEWRRTSGVYNSRRKCLCDLAKPRYRTGDGGIHFLFLAGRGADGRCAAAAGAAAPAAAASWHARWHVSAPLHGPVSSDTAARLSAVDRWLGLALSAIALDRGDEVTRAVCGELLARLVRASTAAEVGAATYGATMFITGALRSRRA